ncbi:hypothetical protein IFM89_021344 [Coptis chinensis]|uniref:phosphopyruvate hydratase n=1 Tax=Coptis chinensis TaxID=261450 RepID=A0A835IDI5_9MAGN|nr:hypothetical protein IFM89_021344 [Coptis chinensis]
MPLSKTILRTSIQDSAKGGGSISCVSRLFPHHGDSIEQKSVIKNKYGQDATNVGDEGGFAPNIQVKCRYT